MDVDRQGGHLSIRTFPFVTNAHRAWRAAHRSPEFHSITALPSTNAAPDLGRPDLGRPDLDGPDPDRIDLVSTSPTWPALS